MHSMSIFHTIKLDSIPYDTLQAIHNKLPRYNYSSLSCMVIYFQFDQSISSPLQRTASPISPVNHLTIVSSSTRDGTVVTLHIRSRMNTEPNRRSVKCSSVRSVCREGGHSMRLLILAARAPSPHVNSMDPSFSAEQAPK